MKIQYTCVMAKIQGAYKEWYVNGVLKRIELYSDGLLNGPCQYYYIIGGVHKTVKYEDGSEVI
jgi:antitoxin component YwqK of YwqJK toxin-antitoxin module